MLKVIPLGRKVSLFSGLLVILLAASALAFLANIDRLREARDNLIYDSRGHYLPCDELPASEEVVRVVSEHQDVVQQIEQVNPGLVMVQIDNRTCPGRSDIVISYASHQDRVAIEKILNAKTFFGVPYRLVNV